MYFFSDEQLHQKKEIILKLVTIQDQDKQKITVYIIVDCY